MLLTEAIELVVSDTRENTDPNMTISEAIESARECNVDDLGVINSQELLDAYLMVCDASDAEIEHATGLVIADEQAELAAAEVFEEIAADNTAGVTREVTAPLPTRPKYVENDDISLI